MVAVVAVVVVLAAADVVVDRWCGLSKALLKLTTWS